MATLPYSGLAQPDIHVTEDPEWSQDINELFTAYDSHDHITGNKKIVSEAINIDADLAFAGNNAVGLRSSIYNDQTALLDQSTDICSVYFKDGNLYANNSSGQAVRITSGSSVDITDASVNSLETANVTNSFTISPTTSATYFQVTISSGKLMYLPAASSVAAGRFYYVKDAGGNFQTYNLSLIRSGSDTINKVAATYTCDRSNGTWLLVSDGISNWNLTEFETNRLRLNTTSSTSVVANNADITLTSSTINLTATQTKVSGELIGATGHALTFGYTKKTIPSTSYTMTDSYQTGVLELAGTLSGDTTVTLPATSGMIKIIKDGATHAGHTLSLKCAGSSVTTAVQAGQNIIAYCDGTDLTAFTYLDGINGGSYSPSTPITLNSSGITLNSGTILDLNAANVSSDADTEWGGTFKFKAASKQLFVSGASIAGRVTYATDAYLDFPNVSTINASSSLAFSGNYSFINTSTVSIAGTQYINSGAYLSASSGSTISVSGTYTQAAGSLSVSSGATVSLDSGSTTTIAGTANLSGTLNVTTGRIVERVITGSNTTKTYYCTDADVIIAPLVTSSSKIWTLSNTGAVKGVRLTITALAQTSATYHIVIQNAASTLLCNLRNTTTNDTCWATFIYNGTQWEVEKFGSYQFSL
jgi:hypothetical protein